MRLSSRFLLLALGFIANSSLLNAADSTSPAALVSTAESSPAIWPMAVPGRSFDRDVSSEDIPSVEVPTNQTPQIPPMLDLTTAPSSLWTRIRLGFGLPNVASPLVKEQEDWYANRPDYIKRTVQRSSRYL